jgi:hypothetical protein
MTEWVEGLLIVFAVVGVGVVVLRAVVSRIFHLAARAGRGTLGALSTGGVSLLTRDPAHSLETQPARRPISLRSLALDALATGGVSLLYNEAPKRKDDEGEPRAGDKQREDQSHPDPPEAIA